MNTYRNILHVGAAMLLSSGALTTASAYRAYPGYYCHHRYHGHHRARVVIVNPAPVYEYRPYRYNLPDDYGFSADPLRNNMVIRGGAHHYH